MSKNATCATCGKKATTIRLGRDCCRDCAKQGDERLMKDIDELARKDRKKN